MDFNRSQVNWMALELGRKASTLDLCVTLQTHQQSNLFHVPLCIPCGGSGSSLAVSIAQTCTSVADEYTNCMNKVFCHTAFDCSYSILVPLPAKGIQTQKGFSEIFPLVREKLIPVGNNLG